MELILKERVLDLSNTQIMGILNVTPDSFFDGGCYCTISKAIDHVSNMIACGANFIDIGGESTRPGFKMISDEEEANRVLPVISEIIHRFDTFVSINTSSALVMQESIKLGVHLINDVRSLSTIGSMKVAKMCNLPICLMHMKENLQIIKNNVIYSSDIVNSIDDYFTKQIKRCELAGINRNRLLIDPGFGFSKSLTHNYQILLNLKHFHHFGLPILVGMSRKLMLNYSNVCISPKERLIGSIASSTIAAMQGAHIVRVHDVKETAEALQIVKLMYQQKMKKRDS